VLSEGERESSQRVWPVGDEGVLNPETWLGANIGGGERIGYDPNTMSHTTFNKYSEVGGCGLGDG